MDLLDWKPTKSGKPRLAPKPRKAPAALEFRTCCALADTLRRFAEPGWRWTHFPAGEYRRPETGERLARMGLKKGWPDYQFLSPTGVTFYLELKRKGNALTAEQDEFRRVAEPLNIWGVARSYEQAIAILQQWGVLSDRIKVQ
jgi:hypothetical protein